MFVKALRATSLLFILTCIVCDYTSKLYDDYYIGYYEDAEEEEEFCVVHRFLNETLDGNSPYYLIRYFYFLTHDINMDSRLDGLELIKAIQHHQEEDGYRPNCVFSDEELVRFLDPLLERDDLNRDGLLNYHDYGQRWLYNKLGFFTLLWGKPRHGDKFVVKSSEC